jgi:hypothetical protein
MDCSLLFLCVSIFPACFARLGLPIAAGSAVACMAGFGDIPFDDLLRAPIANVELK